MLGPVVGESSQPVGPWFYPHLCHTFLAQSVLVLSGRRFASIGLIGWRPRVISNRHSAFTFMKHEVFGGEELAYYGTTTIP